MYFFLNLSLTITKTILNSKPERRRFFCVFVFSHLKFKYFSCVSIHPRDELNEINFSLEKPGTACLYLVHDKNRFQDNELEKWIAHHFTFFVWDALCA